MQPHYSLSSSVRPTQRPQPQRRELNIALTRSWSSEIPLQDKESQQLRFYRRGIAP